MNEVYDVVIIGGGVVGCGTARELMRRRARVLLLEKTNDICNGQSKANTAIIHGGYDAKPGTLKAKVELFSCLSTHRNDRDIPRCHSLIVLIASWIASLEAKNVSPFMRIKATGAISYWAAY